MCFPNNADGFLFQKVATRIGNLLCLNYGLLFGITSSQILLYQSADTPLSRVIDAEGASLLGAYLCLGGILGSLIFGYATNKIGPKSALLLCGLLQIGCWFCILFGYNINHIYSSRIVGGLAAGGSLTVLPMYIREISEEKNRCQLEGTIEPARNLGIFLGFVLAAFAPYDYLAVIGCGTSFIFTMCFPFMPESPYYFVRKGDVAMMEKSLRWFRGIRQLEDRDKPEFLEEVKKFVDQNKGYMKFDEVISTSYKARLMAISAVLVITSQFCGIFLILNYGETIFQQVVTPIPAHWSAITLAFAQLVGSSVGTLIQERVNRRILLCITSLLSGLSLVALASVLTFVGLVRLSPEQMGWLPLSFLVVHLFIANLGFYPLAYVVISEIAPPRMRGSITTWAMGVMWLLALLTVKFYYVLVNLIGFAGLLWIFASFCIFEFLFTIWFVPETRGKSFAEISTRLGGWASSISK